MLTTITTATELAEAQAQFRYALRAHLPRRQPLNVGFQGESLDVEVETNGHLWYTHAIVGEPKRRRYWNAFGFFSGRSSENITVEINSPLAGVDRRTGGGFAKAEGRFQAVFHRGKVGGGRPGIGQSAFLEWYASRPSVHWIDIDDLLPRPIRAILVGHFEESDFFPSLLHFVSEVQAFKQRHA